MRLAILVFLSGAMTILAQVNTFSGTMASGDSRARDPFSSFPISGLITGPSASDMAQLRVELVDPNSRIVRAESIVSASGLFSFGAMPSGAYELRVSSVLGGMLHTRDIHTNAHQQVQIVLSPVTRPAVAPVSLRRLQHQVPKQARKKMEAAEKLFREGKKFEAYENVQAAVAIDPDYFEALSNLGALELIANEPAKASVHLAKALEIEPAASLVAANLSAAHLLLDHFAEAEAAARQSIRANPNFGRSRYLLAVSLLKQDRVTPEALNQLELARKDFPAAEDLLKIVRPQLVQQ
jgi:tetratricopeptide (TPR) repeat protein